MGVVSHRGGSDAPLIGALRQLRDPLLLFALPVCFAVLIAAFGYGASFPFGFDFRGTLWEPARAFLDGGAIYPAPTRDAVAVGNPAVYPPVFILASVPLAALPWTIASWLWLLVLAAAVIGSMWIVGVRDWRCLVLAVASPVVVHGLWYGNLTVLLLVPLALAWRYRDTARIAGLAVGAAVAAKLFVWPLIVWLVLTRRFRAAAWAVASAVLLALCAWALIGFDGLRDYPRLLGAVQDVYAVRSFSLATVAGALGASVHVAVATCALAGLFCVGAAALLVGRRDGDRRSFALLVAACVLASPVVWPNYAALLYVPIAITWPRLSPTWFFGYAVWLVAATTPNAVARGVPAPPPGVLEQAWLWSHHEPALWFAAWMTAIIGVITLVMVCVRRSGGDGRVA
jgi:Glycosyltransferase family 87